MPAKPKSTGASGADAPSASPAKKAAPSRPAAAKAAEGSADTPPTVKQAPAATLDLLARFAETNQVLLFTHHKSVRDDARRLEEKGSAAIVEIDRMR